MAEQKNKAVVRINGSEYAFASTDSEEYIQRVAYYVDKKMTALSMQDTRLSTALAAVLTSVNICDEFFKAKDEADKLHTQLLKYVEENASLKKAMEQANSRAAALDKEAQQLKIRIAKLETELEK